MAKTISFVKGKGIINHYNREFATENVDPNRIKDNIVYVQQDLVSIVLHLDEKTLHLHIDYIPAATGYSQGLKIRNSLLKALENQNFSNKNGINTRTLYYPGKKRTRDIERY